MKKFKMGQMGIAVLLMLWAMVACGTDNDETETKETEEKETEIEVELPAEMLEGTTDVLLIDDFEDGDEFNETGGYWMTFDDRHQDGESTVWPDAHQDGTFESDTPGYGDEGRAAHIKGTTGSVLGFDYVSLMANLHPDGFCPKATPTKIDMNEYDGVQFMAKGELSGGTLTFKIFHGKDGEKDNCEIGYPDSLTEWADYMITFEKQLTKEWSLIRIRFDELAQPSWGKTKVDIEDVLAHAKSLTWQYEKEGGEIDLWIDNLTLFKAEPGEKTQSPDLVILDPVVPDEREIEDLNIDNPLQELAMASLDKGYNITNWLEQDDFDNFDLYNEEFIEHLAENGFKSLRLPIDLDRYIEDRDDYFNGGEGPTVDPQLFEILDAFDEWTEAHGLSLTIDYHQYDGSFDLEDALDVDGATALWSAVAEHFADNPREDLFFELANEVEQSGNVSQISAEVWTDVAQQFIDAIRAHDTNRVLLFGDVEWYGIHPLTQRDPFDDERIIYVFHFYEPYIFTHQGASWATLSAVHDLPYPYDPERWSEYYDELGFDPTVQDQWLIDRVHAYYDRGNRSALWNAIVPAKEWGVEHQVPVICNEFGAWNGTSQVEDRIRYYEDVISVFEELEIPWQHWFMIMNEETGEIDSDLKAAFGLE